MTKLTWDQAFELAAVIRAKADADDKQAATFDTFTKESGFTPGSVEWALKQRVAFRDRAAAYRSFARELLDAAR